MHFFSFRTRRGMFFVLFFVPQFTNTFRTQQKYRDPGSISSSYLCRMQTYCSPFCLSNYPKHKIKCWSKWQPSYGSVLQFSLAPLVFLYFGLHFRIVAFLRRNLDPGKMFYMAAVTNAAATVSSTSFVGLFLLSEYAWPTRVTPLLISCQKFVWSCGRSTFDDYRCTIPGTNFISYQHYSIIPGTKGKSTFQLIRHTYVPGTCMYAMSTSHTWRPVLGFSIHALEVFWIFCCRTPR